MLGWVLLAAVSACQPGAGLEPRPEGEAPAPPADEAPLEAQAPAPDPVAPQPAAPPLEPPVEGGLSLDDFIQRTQEALERDQQQGRRSRAAAPPEEPTGPLLYRWVDELGQVNVVSDESLVPAAYRDRVQRLRASSPPPAPPLAYHGGGYAEPDYQAQRKRDQEATYSEWTRRLEALRGELERTRSRLAEVQNSPPDCSLSLLPELGGVYDPDCESRWKTYKAHLRDTEKRLLGEIDQLRDAARRAGVPPGYVR